MRYCRRLHDVCNLIDCIDPTNFLLMKHNRKTQANYVRPGFSHQIQLNILLVMPAAGEIFWGISLSFHDFYCSEIDSGQYFLEPYFHFFRSTSLLRSRTSNFLKNWKYNILPKKNAGIGVLFCKIFTFLLKKGSKNGSQKMLPSFANLCL